MCGEIPVCERVTYNAMERPPRAWGRPPTSPRPCLSADKPPHAWGLGFTRTISISQTDPHVRGEAPYITAPMFERGQTPTCVGRNTLGRSGGPSLGTTDPHVCGEDVCGERYRDGRGRATPTRVGRTSRKHSPATFCRTNPHVCGEDACARPKPFFRREQPPRVCGEDGALPWPSLRAPEQPPRVWGEPLLSYGFEDRQAAFLLTLPESVVGVVPELGEWWPRVSACCARPVGSRL